MATDETSVAAAKELMEALAKLTVKVERISQHIGLHHPSEAENEKEDPNAKK